MSCWIAKESILHPGKYKVVDYLRNKLIAETHDVYTARFLARAPMLLHALRELVETENIKYEKPEEYEIRKVQALIHADEVLRDVLCWWEMMKELRKDESK